MNNLFKLQFSTLNYLLYIYNLIPDDNKCKNQIILESCVALDPKLQAYYDQLLDFIMIDNEITYDFEFF